MTHVYAYNARTGKTVYVPTAHISHPILGRELREVRSGKRRARLSEIVKDEAVSRKTRLTDTVAPDMDKEH